MEETNEHERRQTWERYASFLKEGLRGGFCDRYPIFDTKYETYAEYGVVFGDFSVDLAAKLKSALIASPVEPVHNGGALPQFDPTVLSESVIADVNRDADYYRLSAEALWWLGDIADELAEQIASFIGSPWRILCAKAWKTTHQSGSEGPHAWHLDGLPTPTAKIMIFPHAIGPALGTTEFKFPNGETLAIERDGPSWALFKSSELLHRGIRPSDTSAERYVAELTIIVSPRFGLMPIFAGASARQPHFPWLRSAYSRY